MIVQETKLPDVLLFKPKTYADSRGFFAEVWNKKTYAEAGVIGEFVQDNHSRSVSGTLRGLHYQIEKPQGKLVRVSNGAVFDVAVDLRRSSPTFGNWIGEVLSADNMHQLWVPPGFAHGFFVLSDVVEFQYKCSEYYYPSHERTILWNDQDLGIVWPMKGHSTPVLSVKDQNGSKFSESPVFE